jgi:pyruvate formate lyase activating enzyme
MTEAQFYSKLEYNKVKCELCPHNCIIQSGNIGICRARKNIDGVLYTNNYGETITVSIDPMEKKPLYHFHTGKNIISVGSNSCNLSCKFCQNYHSSQLEVPTMEITPTNLLKQCKIHECNFVAFTYTEPTTWFEFILESSKLLYKNGIKTVMVTNGFINQEPLKELLPYIDAMNIDLKAYDDKFYKNICNGSLQPVLNTIKTAHKKCHIEITNLIITDENDSDKQIKDLVDFVAEVDNNIPLHFSRYYPTYKMESPPTPLSMLQNAKEIADQKLKYVYLGNIVTDRNTYCPNCGNLLILRNHQMQNNIIDAKCSSCNQTIYGEFL